MTTTADLVQATRRHLLSGHRERMNKLNGALDDSTATVVCEFDVAAIQEGSVVCVGLEEMLVWSVTASSKTLTVERGFNGSTAADHADDTLLFVNPVFSQFAIFSAVNDDLADLSSPESGLFRVRTVELTGAANTYAYDLTSVTNVDGILSVTSQRSGVEGAWVPVYNWRVERSQNTTDFPSGNALRLDPRDVEIGQKLRVVYKDKFGSLSALSDNVETVTGLHAEAHDIPPLGAAARLLASRPARRTILSSQADPRRAEEVGTQDALGSPAGLLRLRSQRLLAESARLQQRYPWRFKR